MIVSVPKETAAGERRVAARPRSRCQAREGRPRGRCAARRRHGGRVPRRLLPGEGRTRLEAEAFERADVLLHVQPPAIADIGRLKQGATLIGFLQPYSNAAGLIALAARKATAFSIELMPRITRAQPMDALSAMSTVAGYKAVVLAASHLPKLFPLLMTAAGTVQPARVFILGAGVAGLQAIGTARRLGGVVEAYDTRPVVKEQVESLGAKFVELALATKDAEEKTGYARAQSEEFYQQQRQLLSRSVAAADVVVATALIPGRRAPILITEEMVQLMRPGSVIVDLAAEQGGNCALTEPGQEVQRHGVLILGRPTCPVRSPTTPARCTPARQPITSCTWSRRGAFTSTWATN